MSDNGSSGENPRIEAHYDDLAERWDAVVNSPVRRELVWPTLKSVLPDLIGKTLVDVGCGSGVFTAALVEAAESVVGIDISEQMIQCAKERVPEGEFYQGDISEGVPEIETDAADVVLCQHVYSHLPLLTDTTAFFRRVLRPGGTLVVSTHNTVHDYQVVRERSYPQGHNGSTPESTVMAEEGAPTYGDTERYDIKWGTGTVSNRGTYFRRPYGMMNS